jgi:hypothetical protein
MITKTTNRTRTAVSGVTYDFDFRIDSASDLEVYGIDSDGVATEITTGFSVAFDPDAETGTVTFDSEPSTYDEILRLRSKPYTQGTDVPIREGFSEEDIEGALDSLEMQIQQLKEITDYCVKQDLTNVLVNIVFPAPEDGKAIVWDGTSGEMANKEIPTQAEIDSVDAAVIAANAAKDAAVIAQAAAELAAENFEFASKAEAEAGVNTTKSMNPLRVAEAIAALTPDPDGTILAVIDGGGGVITAGKKLQLEIPFACTLNRYTMVADAAGAIVIDVNRSTYANFPTTASICGGGKECTIAATNQKSQDTDISNWTSVAIAAGDVLEFEVDSCTTITRCTLSLKYTRT